MFEERTLKLQTRCHECIFAKISNNIQIGCEFGRSAKFTEQGKTERKYIEEVSALEISTVCNTYRDKEWQGNKEFLEVKNEVRTFVTAQVDFIIIERSLDDLETVLKKFNTTLNSILAQEILPKSVIFVIDNDPLFKDIDKMLETIEMFLLDSEIEFQLVRNIEKPVEYYRLLDVGVSKAKRTYYTHYTLGDSIPTDIIMALDCVINDNLWTVCYVECMDKWDKDEENHKLDYKEEIVQRNLHKQLGGNEGSYIKDKIEHLANSQGVKHKIMYTWDQLHAKKLS